jgi:hypothetical protein
MSDKPTKRPSTKAPPAPSLPLTSDQAAAVKGGAKPKFGDIDGESVDIKHQE